MGGKASQPQATDSEHRLRRVEFDYTRISYPLRSHTPTPRPGGSRFTGELNRLEIGTRTPFFGSTRPPKEVTLRAMLVPYLLGYCREELRVLARSSSRSSRWILTL